MHPISGEPQCSTNAQSQDKPFKGDNPRTAPRPLLWGNPSGGCILCRYVTNNSSHLPMLDVTYSTEGAIMKGKLVSSPKIIVDAPATTMYNSAVPWT